jgi:superfamily II DNA or RNA helicase
VSKPSKQERHQQQLKLRRDAERREFDREDSDHLVGEARSLYKQGDAPAAHRLGRKALALTPGSVPALALLGQIHFEAAQYADAAYYFGLLRKRVDDPGVIYNLGLAHQYMGRKEQALAEFREFLTRTRPLPEKKWLPLRETAARLARDLDAAPPAVPASGEPARANPDSAPAAVEPETAPARTVAVEFLPTAAPKFSSAASGRLADYFLKRTLLELRLAQNFDDLVCLPFLRGVDSYAYQHDTVRKVLRLFKGRAILADEVGLGKTIEACLALKEYWTRGMARRALILVPPSLVPQWKEELTEKFGLAPVSPDGAEFRRGPAQFWSQQPLIVASIATARLEPHASALAAQFWDLLIVDEAHCLKNRSSANWKLVNSLQRKFMLLLTATPVENSLTELYNLVTLLKPGLLATESEFRKVHVTTGRPKAPKNPEGLRALLAEVMVRNTRSVADVRLPNRVAASLVVPPSPEEERLYEMVTAFVAERYQAGGQPAFLLGSLQRQAGSSPQALCRSAGRALAAENRWSATDRQELARIQEAAAEIRDGGKGVQLGQMLAARQGKVVVFTEFIPTLEHLGQICQRHGVPCVHFAGELSRAEKEAAIARFRDEVDVLLSTGVGGEGRNLQFANTVINFDLPWNPMRLEQRIGRVHRIGQTEDVFVFNYCQRGTIEEQLLRVLHDKVNMFELVVGEMGAILGSLDDGRDFAELVLELWVSARRDNRAERAFDELAEQLLAARHHYVQSSKLDEALFRRDYEV